MYNLLSVRGSKLVVFKSLSQFLVIILHANFCVLSTSVDPNSYSRWSHSDTYSWQRVSSSTCRYKQLYNRPKIFFCFSANFFNVLKPDGSSRPSMYLKVGTVSSTWPLMVILREAFILFHLREIGINLHLEELRNM